MGVSPSSVASCSKLISGLTLANSSSSLSSMLGASVKNFVIDSQKSSSTPDILLISGCQELHCVATQRAMRCAEFGQSTKYYNFLTLTKTVQSQCAISVVLQNNTTVVYGIIVWQLNYL